MKQKILIIVGILSLTAVIVFLKPFLNQRAATRIVIGVLDSWKNNTPDKTYDHWEDPEKSVPVYDLISFKIKTKAFEEKDDIHYAHILVTLEFLADNAIPSGNWTFELKKTKYGWKIIDFHRD